MIGVLVAVGAGVAAGITWLAREISCGEAQPECNREALAILLLSVAGLVPAMGTLVASWGARWHVWLWLAATAAVYAVWALAFSSWASG